METNRLTIKSQEAMQAAQAITAKRGHIEVDGEHLLLALLQQEGLIPNLLAKMAIPVAELIRAVERQLDSRPSVSGPGIEEGKIYISQRLNRLLVTAEEEAKRLKDDFVSVEHLFLTLIDEQKRTEAGKLLQAQNISRDRVLTSLTEIRGHQRVSSPDPESSYQALEKYGRDLVDAAQKGSSIR